MQLELSSFFYDPYYFSFNNTRVSFFITSFVIQNFCIDILKANSVLITVLTMYDITRQFFL
jgi:hypothetical protein